MDIQDIDETTRREWAEANVPLLDALTTKIKKFGLWTSSRNRFEMSSCSTTYVGEQLLQQVFNDAPETHVRLENRIRGRERLLATARRCQRSCCSTRQSSSLTLYRTALAESKALQSTGAEAIAYGTAADWMVRCPLDFNADD